MCYRNAPPKNREGLDKKSPVHARAEADFFHPLEFELNKATKTFRTKPLTKKVGHPSHEHLPRSHDA